MGNYSGTLNQEEIEDLSRQTGISIEELQAIDQVFRRLDKENKQYVTKKDFLDRLNPNDPDEKAFLIKLLDLFNDRVMENRINFQEFAIALHDFKTDNKEGKLRLLFNLVDTDGNGLLSAKELEEAFRLVKLEHLTKQDIAEIAYQTLLYADSDQDGYINFEEFKEFYNTVLQITI